MKRAGISFATLLALFLIYSALVVPEIEPPARQRTPTGSPIGAAAPSATDRYQADLAGLFPTDAWENESPKILRSRNTLLLFQDYQPQSDGTIRVYPCTAVVLGDRADDQQRRATSLILQAPNGAVLQLSRPVDMSSTQLGQPVAGFLLGQIRIHSQGQADGTGRLNIITSDVQIKPEMILTPHEVELEYEASHARGRDLMIKLMPLKEHRRIEHAGGWAGIRSIELVHLDHLHLLIREQDAEEPSVLASPGGTPVDVACDGPLRVDFVDNLVTLEEHVQLRRHTLEGQVDTLQCQKLSLHLQPPETEPTPAREVTEEATARGDSREAADNQSADIPARATAGQARHRLDSLPRLEISKVVAEGDPVVLDAPSRGAHVRSRRMLYDLRLGQFQLWAAPDRADDQVLFRYQQQEVKAREIDCLVEASGRVHQLRAQGPGRFSGQLSGAQAQPVEAEWQRELAFEPDGPLFRLRLDEAAQVRVDQAYAISAEAIHLWLESQPPTAAGGDVEAAGSPLAMSLRPYRVVAVAHPQHPSSRPVRLHSQDLVATTQRLDARFEHQSVDRSTAGVRPARIRMASSQWSPSSPPNGAVQPSAPAREVRVFGRELKTTLRIHGHDVTVDTLELEQDVRIQQFARSEPDRPLFDLQAQRVLMRDPAAQQLHTLTAFGQPVLIQSDQMQLQTTELSLDQARNLIWTQQPGQMVVLVDRSVQGERLTTPQEMTITWARRMDFDGLNARFDGGVDIRSVDTRMRGESLDVRLTQKVDFGKSSSSGSLDIRQVHVKGNVLIETAEYNEQQLVSVAYMQVPFAQIDRQTGELLAGGPGRVTTVRDGFRGNMNPVAATSPPSAADADAKTFLQVDYQGEITGNIDRHVVDFYDRVEVIYGPVLSWNETLSADAILRKNDVLLSCDRLTVAQSALAGPGRAVLDLLAQGNAYVEGQAFTARGERVSYEQSKELLVLEGTGRTDAVLSHQVRVGGPRSETAARKILYWTRTRRVEIDDARYLDLSNLGS